MRKAVSHLHFLQNLLETYYKPTSSEEKYRENLSRESKLKSRSETTATARSFSRGEDESRLRSAMFDDAESIEGYSSRGNKLRWLLSSDSLGDYSKEDDLDRMLESSASGAVLEVCLLFVNMQQGWVFWGGEGVVLLLSIMPYPPASLVLLLYCQVLGFPV